MPRERKETSEIFNLTLTVSFGVQDIAFLIHDVLLGRMHNPEHLPYGHAYKLALLKALYANYPKAFVVGLTEARTTWSDVAIGRLLSDLEGPPEGEEPADAHTFFTLKAIRKSIEALKPGSQLVWTVGDLDQDQVFAFLNEIERQGYATQLTAGKLGIRAPE